MASGSRVLELRRRGDRENNCYFSLASALDLPYDYLQCGVTDEREPTRTAEFVVDADALGRVLSSMDGRYSGPDSSHHHSGTPRAPDVHREGHPLSGQAGLLHL